MRPLATALLVLFLVRADEVALSNRSSVNTAFDGVYVVNLQRRTDRWARVSTELAQAGIAATRIEAVDGQSLTRSMLERFSPSARDARGRQVLPGQVGCALSHLRATRAALDAGLNSVLVLEDDVVLRPEFERHFRRALAAVPSDWQMLFLGSSACHATTPVGGDAQQYRFMGCVERRSHVRIAMDLSWTTSGVTWDKCASLAAGKGARWFAMEFPEAYTRHGVAACGVAHSSARPSRHVFQVVDAAQCATRVDNSSHLLGGQGILAVYESAGRGRRNGGTNVFMAQNCWTTHAYALRKDGIALVHDALATRQLPADTLYVELQKELKSYVVLPSLVHQRKGHSDITFNRGRVSRPLVAILSATPPAPPPREMWTLAAAELTTLLPEGGVLRNESLCAAVAALVFAGLAPAPVSGVLLQSTAATIQRISRGEACACARADDECGAEVRDALVRSGVAAATSRLSAITMVPTERRRLQSLLVGAPATATRLLRRLTSGALTVHDACAPAAPRPSLRLEGDVQTCRLPDMALLQPHLIHVSQQRAEGDDCYEAARPLLRGAWFQQIGGRAAQAELLAALAVTCSSNIAAMPSATTKNVSAASVCRGMLRVEALAARAAALLDVRNFSAAVPVYEEALEVITRINVSLQHSSSPSSSAVCLGVPANLTQAVVNILAAFVSAELGLFHWTRGMLRETTTHFRRASTWANELLRLPGLQDEPSAVAVLLRRHAAILLGMFGSVRLLQGRAGPAEKMLRNATEQYLGLGSSVDAEAEVLQAADVEQVDAKSADNGKCPTPTARAWTCSRDVDAWVRARRKSCASVPETSAAAAAQKDAQPVLGECCLPGDDPILSWLISNLGLARLQAQGAEQSRGLLQEALRMGSCVFSPPLYPMHRHPTVAAGFGDLAELYALQGDPMAVDLMRESHVMRLGLASMAEKGGAEDEELVRSENMLQTFQKLFGSGGSGRTTRGSDPQQAMKRGGDEQGEESTMRYTVNVDGVQVSIPVRDSDDVHDVVREFTRAHGLGTVAADALKRDIFKKRGYFLAAYGGPGMIHDT